MCRSFEIGTYQADDPADQKEKLRFWINILQEVKKIQGLIGRYIFIG
jgi:hypothetical protein